MQNLPFFLKTDRNPLLPILILLAAFVVVAAFIVLAPDFEVPQSSRIGHETKPALPWYGPD